MPGYILKRLISAIPVIIGLSVIVFGIMALIPGDPALAILGSYATPENVARINRELGLDRPVWEQYFVWVGNMVQGDFGRSFILNRPVIDEVLERFGATLILAGASLVMCSILGILAGVVSAVRQFGWTDRIVTFFVLIGISTPAFWLGLLFILLFAVQLRTARAKGLNERAVIYRHAFKAALVSIIPVIGIQAGFVMGGAVYIETVFQWPGIGAMLVNAISTRDILLVQGGVLVVAVTYVLINLLADVAQAILDPRLKT